ncbi:MAG: hypothetical protein EA407_00505 [Rhodobacteraceae bacterium]|nr:MAG: hypothetical protein EA407_00505 [Paracoccaceae bacterium]
MQGESARLGANLAAIGVLLAVVAAALTGLGAGWRAWVACLIWSALWVTAALGMGDAASRKWLAGTLRRSTYTQIYTTLIRRLLTPLWTRFCDPAPDKAPWPTQFRAALTWRLYDRALLIAVVYPILLLVGQWVVTGAEGRVGSFVVLPEAVFWPERTVVILMLLIVSAGFLGRKLASASQRPAVAKLADWLPLLAAAIAGTGAVTFAGAGAGTFALAGAIVLAVGAAATGAIAMAIAFVIAAALAVAGVGAAAFAGVFAGAVALAVVVKYLDKSARPRAARALVTGGVVLFAPVLAFTVDWSTIPGDFRTVFLFLAVLPLLNALFDVVSYAATLSLTRRGLQSRLPLLWGVADLALACLLFLALGATLVAAIHGLNLLAGVLLLDLVALFDGVTSTPGAYFWLYAMLFSTILPTALHAALSLLGLQGIWPRAPRRRVAIWVESADASALQTFRASLALGMVWTVPLLLLVAIIWALWALSAPAILWLLSRYLDALIWIATHPIGAM